MPSSVPPYEPQLATLVHEAPKGDQWFHQVKHDGWWMGLRIDAGAATLLSRRKVDFTKEFPEVIGAAGREVPAASALLAGELVVMRPDGTSQIDDLPDVLRKPRAAPPGCLPTRRGARGRRPCALGAFRVRAGGGLQTGRRKTGRCDTRASRALQPDKAPSECSWARIDPRAGSRPERPARRWWARKKR